ncbi:MAG: DNA-binding transcriptional regulator [Kiritimatiellia bacterium]
MKRTTSSMHTADMVPRVLLVIPTANLIQRQLLNGILRYAHQYGPWEFHMITGYFEEQGIRRTREWGCTGAIVLTHTEKDVNTVLKTGVPVVFINPPKTMRGPGSPIAEHCCVMRDQLAVGRVAAEYFLNRQYTDFGFVGNVRNKSWSRGRQRGFVEHLRKSGFTCNVYPAPSVRESNDFGLEKKKLAAWLMSLPKPVAVMAVRDQRARQIMDICAGEGISVPHEVALLGVDNDEILCETTIPSLSSIALDGENTGYDCARLLDEQMKNSDSAGKPCVLSLEMASVVTRRSTDISCIADPLIAQAMQYVQANIDHSLSVAEVARYLNVSQRLLEMRTRKSIGLTIRGEIQRLRLNRARSMLCNTKMTVSEIALACGFYDPSHLGVWFRKTFKMTPGEFRRSFRKESGDSNE